MPKHSPLVTLTPLSLDRQSSLSLYRQLYDGVRGMILDGQLRAGTRLPSTRDLAAELGLARATVQNAFEQLLAEGYVQGRIGSGTYVADVLPEDRWTRTQEKRKLRTPKAQVTRHAVSQQGELLLSVARSTSLRLASTRAKAFSTGVSALAEFPFSAWGRLMSRNWRRKRPELLAYQHSAGYLPLREALASYLGPARGVRCSPEQVIIVAGSQQALDLSARVLLNPADEVWVEDPGYPGARGALLSAGAKLVPVPVDESGLIVAHGVVRAPQARLACITPSHQFPLGATLSLSRRLALLEWADRAGAWILEDDYDSEYRFSGRPLMALQGLDTEGRVIYIGTFSKTLFPALRLGYVVVPPDLVDAFTAARYVADRHSSSLEQATLADFIAEGHFARHIRRMRALYAERQAVLIDAVSHDLGGRLEIAPAETGMHLVAWLPKGMDDVAVSKKAAAHQVETAPLSSYSLSPLKRGALLLGYGGVNAMEIRAGVRRLAQALSNGT